MESRRQDEGDSPPPFRHSFSSSSFHPPSPRRDRTRNANDSNTTDNPDRAPAETSSAGAANASGETARYRECLRNHAARLGNHVLDGCGEFMPETGDALKCAACGCHRSFHRKETDGSGGDFTPRYLLPPPHSRHHHLIRSQDRQQFLPSPSAMTVFGGNASRSGGTTTESSSEERHAGVPHGVVSPRPQARGVPKKRHRTKFTPEQKERMLGFAESLGWRVLKQDETVTERFCAEIGISRQVLKVWMHNNKHTVRRHQQGEQQSQGYEEK